MDRLLQLGVGVRGLPLLVEEAGDPELGVAAAVGVMAARAGVEKLGVGGRPEVRLGGRESGAGRGD